MGPLGGRARRRHETWGRDPELCVVSLDETFLEPLGEAVTALSAASESPVDCPPCRDCPTMNISWKLGDARGGLRASDRCLFENHTLAPLTRLLQEAASLPPSLCEPVAEQNPFDSAQLPRIQITSAPQPVFSWTPGGAVEIVVEAATPPAGFDISPAMWHLVAPPSGSFGGPVTYGEAPLGAKVATSPQRLVSGVEYRVTIRRPDPAGTGTGFDPSSHEYDASATFIAR